MAQISSAGGITQDFNFRQIQDMVRPKQSGWGKFARVMGGIAGAVSSFVPGGGVIAGLISGISSPSMDYNQMMGNMQALMVENQIRSMQLIGIQMRVQEHTQVVNMVSNILKSKHEAEMSVARNFRS